MTAKPQGIALIPAGSLFTSCIEQVEPLGIQDMRFAKAEYIRALKDLRAADAELVRAEAAHELARARYVDAMTANLNADTEYQNLLNEYQQLINEARQDTNDYIAAKTASAIDRIKKEIELRELQHQKNIADAKKDLAYAEEQLRVALRDIALYSQSLTPAEQSALAAAVYMYETAFEETADQTMVVMQAQRTLDSLKLVRQVGPDTAYDKSSKAYIGQVDKWKKDIETMQVEQALVAAILLAVPDSLVYDDVDGWKEQVDELVKDSTELAYNQYEVKTEMANYYTANIHDGVKVFNAMIDEFKNEWWEGGLEPTAPSKPGTEPKPTDKKYNPENYLSDSLKFKPFVLKDQEITPRSFNKFAYLLGSYMQDSPYSKADPKNPIMGLNTANDTLFIVGPVQQDMKDFILGAEGNGEKSQKGTFNKEDLVANYGLWGAYDILEREMVTKKDAAADPEKALEALELADSIWAAHRQILIDGLAAYEPYAEAIAQYEADVKENGKGATAMVAAVATLRDELAGVDGVHDFASFTINDSTAIFDALVNFAKARENYLEYDPEGQPHDLDYFRYAKSRTAGEVVVDSVLFSALSWDDFKAHRYDYDPETGKTPISGKDVSETPALNNEDGFMNIATQLLGSAVATKAFNYPCKTEPSETVDPDKLSKEDFNGTVAFYKLYDIDGYVDPKPTKILLTGTSTEYVPGNLEEDKKAIKAAVEGFVAVYNSFWNLSVTATMTGYETTTTGYYAVVESGAKADKIAEAKAKAEATIENKPTATPAGLFVYNADDVKRYTLNTFKPYVEYAPIVAFTNGVSIDTTDAMKAILTAVDPKSSDLTDNTQWDGGIFENQSAIFNGGATDFWKFMKAYSDYYDAVNDKVEEDLAYIKAWIEGVEATFEADEEAAPGKATKQYNDDHKAWETTKKNYDTKKAAYDEYVAAKAEFAGITVDEKGDTTVNAIVGPLTDPCTGLIPGEEFATIASVEIPELVEPKNVYGFYPGLWNEDLGGAQLEAAQALFPEYPEELQEWDVTIQETEDELLHYATLIQAAKKAYFAAAKIAGENVEDAANWDELVENYKAANKAYRERLIGIIEDLQADIETIEEAIAKFNQGIPQLDIAIAMAEKELKVETARLQGYEQALAYAKANLDHLLEYIKSLDVNFVVPAVDLDD